MDHLEQPEILEPMVLRDLREPLEPLVEQAQLVELDHKVRQVILVQPVP